MTPYNIIVQIIGIFAMAFNILSFQQKTPKKVMAFLLLGTTLFTIHFFMLGAVIGGLMNIIAAFRSIVYMNKEKLKSDRIYWLLVFIALYILSYILTFTVFKTPFTLKNAILELLPVIALTVSTVSFRMQSAKAIRVFGCISSPSWLIYNIINHSLGATICEALSICSIIIGFFRFDIKKH